MEIKFGNSETDFGNSEFEWELTPFRIIRFMLSLLTSLVLLSTSGCGLAGCAFFFFLATGSGVLEDSSVSSFSSLDDSSVSSLGCGLAGCALSFFLTTGSAEDSSLSSSSSLDDSSVSQGDVSSSLGDLGLLATFLLSAILWISEIFQLARLTGFPRRTGATFSSSSLDESIVLTVGCLANFLLPFFFVWYLMYEQRA
jgi:hypothetical protein